MSNRIGDIKFKIIDPIGKIKIVMLKGEKGDTYDDTDLRNRIRTQDGIIANFIEESTEQIDDLTDLVGTFDGRITDNKNRLDNIIDIIYPIGSIYTSTRNVSPATFLGGTWSQIKDTFLLTAGDTYQAGTTGGEASHTLTSSEMPSHYHTVDSHNHSVDAHAHGIPQLSGSASTITSSELDEHIHGTQLQKAIGAGRSDWGLVAEGAFGGNILLAPNSGGFSYSLPTEGPDKQQHIHSVTTNASSTNSGGGGNTGNASPNTNSVGGGGAHNNMPPYRVVYAWERTA